MNPQRLARTPIGAIIFQLDSCALLAGSERASPRKTAPNTFTKHATASAPMSARPAAERADIIQSVPGPEIVARKSPT